MTSLTRDPLLAIAKGLLIFLMAVMAIAAIACLIVIPVILIWHQDIIAGMTTDLRGISDASFMWAIIAALLCTAGLLAMVWKVFHLLKRIVDTVGKGDPFVPVNAVRLTWMAWLVPGIQVAVMPIAAIGLWISHHVEPGKVDLQFDDGISGNGLLLMLVLFILARVFRQGAAMRAELEGVV